AVDPGNAAARAGDECRGGPEVSGAAGVGLDLEVERLQDALGRAAGRRCARPERWLLMRCGALKAELGGEYADPPLLGRGVAVVSRRIRQLGRGLDADGAEQAQGHLDI